MARAGIAPTFGDSFIGNSHKYGLPPIVLPAAAPAFRRRTPHPGTNIQEAIDKQAESMKMFADSPREQGNIGIAVLLDLPPAWPPWAWIKPPGKGAFGGTLQ